MIVSFDYDGTLTEALIRKLAKKYTSYGVVTYIVTARTTSNYNKDVEATALQIGIPLSRIFYTEGADKVETLKFLNVDIHYDNDELEVELINEASKCIGVLISVGGLIGDRS